MAQLGPVNLSIDKFTLTYIVSVDRWVKHTRRDFKTRRGNERCHGGREEKKNLKYRRGLIESTRPDPERAGRDDFGTGDRCWK